MQEVHIAEWPVEFLALGHDGKASKASMAGGASRGAAPGGASVRGGTRRAASLATGAASVASRAASVASDASSAAVRAIEGGDGSWVLRAVDVLAVTSKDLTKEWWIHIVTGTDQIKNKSVVWELRGSSATSL